MKHQKKQLPSTRGNVLREPYPSDLTDNQWHIIEQLLPPTKSNTVTGGRPREVDMREILNAIFYLLRTGCSWRMLPHDFPEWETVRKYFDQLQKDGTWKRIHDKLRDKVRLRAGKKKQPTAGIIDSQSVKTTEKGGFVAMTLVKR